ncbi:MAG: AAA family ATPase, partial [Polyangiaceae bacterium]
MDASLRELLNRIRSTLAEVIRGKKDVIDLLLVGVLGGGHVLIEDVPGVGKTTLAKALARVFEVDFARVQFTPDLLPADIVGTEVLNPADGSFSFHHGPVFTHVLLADEINRASPRTQSALLEAMGEHQVTVEGKTHPLPDPFFVIATQNPVDFQGTYPLPEAQLDRFLLKLTMGYPPIEDELRILSERKLSDPLDSLEAVATGDDIRRMQLAVRKIEVKESVARYILAITT